MDFYNTKYNLNFPNFQKSGSSRILEAKVVRSSSFSRHRLFILTSSGGASPRSYLRLNANSESENIHSVSYPLQELS